jgi:alpha-N-arabinofuranosidase
VNVNPGGMQWKSDMIGYDALNSFGSPSYYAQKMFNTYLGDQVVSTSAQNLPTQVTKLSGKDSAAGVTPKTIPAMFYVTTRDSKTGTLYLKVVNASGTAQTVLIDILGNTKVAANGTTVVLKADKPEDTNSITDPEKIIPVTAKVNGLGKSFTQIFPPYSIAVLKMEVK